MTAAEMHRPAAAIPRAAAAGETGAEASNPHRR